jgi:molybdopterin converting factor small subunit
MNYIEIPSLSLQRLIQGTKLAVTIKYFGWLSSEMAPETTLDFKGGKRIRDIVKLPEDVDIEELIILKNGKTAKPDDLVEDGDVISVMPHISGG